MLEALPTGGSHVQVVEVGPRDGLQNTPQTLPVDVRVKLIHDLVDAGHTDVEIGSFVHPRWIPQMADTAHVYSQLEKRDDVRYWALLPNLRGFENAMKVGVKHVAVFMSSSESHNRHNLNRTMQESIENVRTVCAAARAEGVTVRGYLSTVFGCPYEGDVDFDVVIDLATMLLDEGAVQISLGDTTGVGDPVDIEPKLRKILAVHGADKIALHTHDTRGVGLVNTTVALLAGVRIFDSSIGGMGGCPYAPGAAGNLATEDLVHLIEGVGLEHSLDLDKLVRVSMSLQERGIKISSRYFPYGRQLVQSSAG